MQQTRGQARATVHASGGRADPARISPDRVGSHHWPPQWLDALSPDAIEITTVDGLDDVGNRFATAGILMPR